MKKNKYLLFLCLIISILVTGCTQGPPTIKELNDAKKKIAEKYDKMAKSAKGVPDELQEGYEDLTTYIEEDYSWIQKQNIEKTKYKSIQEMEKKLSSCQKRTDDLFDDFKYIESRSNKYFKMLKKNLESIDRIDLKRRQERRISDVKSQLDNVLKNTSIKLNQLNEKVEAYAGIVAFLRGDLALDIIGSKTIDDMQEIALSAKSLSEEISAYIEEGNNLIENI